MPALLFPHDTAWLPGPEAASARNPVRLSEEPCEARGWLERVRAVPPKKPVNTP